MKKIGLQLYSVREHFKTEEETKATLKNLAKLGYSELQTAGGCYGFAYDKFRSMANDAGLEIVGTHGDFEQMKKDIDTVIENHKKLGTTNVGIGGFRPGRDSELLKAFIEDVNKIADRLALEGMKFTYHNHHHEFITLDNGKTMMEMIMDGFRENVTFVFDIYWAQYAGCDVCSWMEKLAGKIDILHLKDMRVEYDDRGEIIQRITEIGNGNLDMPKIIKTAEKIGVKYFCVEQDDCPYDYEPSLKLSSDYLHKLCNF